MAAQEKKSLKAIGGFFADFGTAVTKGDAFVKLSLLWMGMGMAAVRKNDSQNNHDGVA